MFNGIWNRVKQKCSGAISFSVNFSKSVVKGVFFVFCGAAFYRFVYNRLMLCAFKLDMLSQRESTSALIHEGVFRDTSGLRPGVESTKICPGMPQDRVNATLSYIDTGSALVVSQLQLSANSLLNYVPGFCMAVIITDCLSLAISIYANKSRNASNGNAISRYNVLKKMVDTWLLVAEVGLIMGFGYYLSLDSYFGYTGYVELNYKVIPQSAQITNTSFAKLLEHITYPETIECVQKYQKEVMERLNNHGDFPEYTDGLSMGLNGGIAALLTFLFGGCVGVGGCVLLFCEGIDMLQSCGSRLFPRTYGSNTSAFFRDDTENDERAKIINNNDTDDVLQFC